jgi:hypothetical protein
MQDGSLGELRLEDILPKLPRVEPTPSQNDIGQIGESDLIRRARVLALAEPWYASLCTTCSTCELLETDPDCKNILWICCRCGGGPMILSHYDSCVVCGHALCSR